MICYTCALRPTVAEPTQTQFSILARRTGRVSRLSGRIDTSNVLASKRNTRGRTSTRDHEHNTADPQPRPRPTLRRSMVRDRNHNWVRNNLGTQCNSPRSPLPRTGPKARSEEHTSELQSRFDLVCRLLLEKKKN